ncbi:hypothetical protein [Microbacterium sp. RURRCA19A]|uniref:hypothetical protein n=1 Tax=Microbacterium sp. RURRCA19A TaxID=1907391 RepID=UPI000954EDEF|nr:hypothetical protein [Microbacterium sp. RURRCA19A]SIS16249.1 Membrane protein involved in the export of O-antigen and teichoic acid [Microbacterium sp. RURRCA19A]
MKVLLARLLGFGSLPLLASLAPLLLLGVVSRASTLDQWAALNIGQAIGSFATAATMFGWQVVGPPAVALTPSEHGRRTTYASSWWLRLGVFGVVTPAAVALSVVTSPGGTGGLAALMCVAAAMSGLSMTWYAIGVGRARLITGFEVFPRMLSLAVGAGLVAVTREPSWYPAAIVGGIVVALTVFHRRYFSWSIPPWPGATALRAAVRTSAPGAGVLMLAGVRSAAPVPAATLVGATGSVAFLASADRLYRYSLFSVSALGDALQNWVLERGGRGRRQRVALVLHGALGVGGALGLAVLGPWTTGVLWGAHVASPPDFFRGYAVAFFFVSVGTPLVRNILVPRARTGWVLLSDAAGLVCGAGAAFPLVAGLGAPGIPWALAVVEGVSVVGYVSAVIVARRAPDPR